VAGLLALVECVALRDMRRACVVDDVQIPQYLPRPDPVRWPKGCGLEMDFVAPLTDVVADTAVRIELFPPLVGRSHCR